MRSNFGFGGGGGVVWFWGVAEVVSRVMFQCRMCRASSSI